MSQFYVGTTAGSLPPTVPTSFVTNSGTAVPAANVLNVFASESSTNVDGGINTTGSGNTVTVLLTNRMTGSVTTSNATPAPLLTLPLGAVPGVYYIEGNLIAFDVTDAAGAGYAFSTAARTTGAAGIEIGTEFKDLFEEAALSSADLSVSISGNSLVISAIGIAGKTIDWNGYLTFRFIS